MRSPRFRRRRKGPDPAPSPAPDPAAWSAYRTLRATSPEVPQINDSGWVASFPPAGAAAGGPLDGSLDGWNVEIWQGLESDSAGAIVMSPDHSLHALLVYERHGRTDGLLRLFAPDGSRSYHNAPEVGSDLNAVVEVLVSMAWDLIAQHVGRELGILSGTDRVRAAESPAFMEFARQGPVPLVASWLVAERIHVGENPDRWIELWAGTVDLRSYPPNPYHTPLVATAIDDGHIRGMVAVEIMPGLHDESYVILFDGHQRTNFGDRRDLPSHPGPAQLASFREIAMDLLTPLLPEEVWHQAALLSQQEPAVVLVPRWHVESELGSVGPGRPVSWFVRAVWPTHAARVLATARSGLLAINVWRPRRTHCSGSPG